MSISSLMPSSERLELMQKGIEQLDQWLSDIIQVGLLKIDFGFSFDQIISRMVDAKLGGIANQLSRIKSFDPAKPDWLDRVASALSKIFALSWELKKIDRLDDKRKIALLSLAGLNFRKADIAMLPGVLDSWLLLGQHQYQEENLTTRRCWFFGRKSHRTALLLDFTFGRKRFENTYQIGQHYQGKMHYYPALFPLRSIFSQSGKANFSVESLPGFDDLSRFLDRFAQAICKDPWLGKFPANLKNVYVHQDQGTFYLIDEGKRILPLLNSEETCWQLLAQGGGHAMTLFGEYTEGSVQVLSLLNENRIIGIS